MNVQVEGVSILTDEDRNYGDREYRTFDRRLDMR